MIHLFQPPGSKLCGQTCVAMLAGVTLEESVRVFGRKGGTNTKQVAEALGKLGIKSGDRLVRPKFLDELPSCCIAKIHFTDAKNTHWTVYRDGLYYDPAYGIYEFPPEYMRVTSYLPVYL